MLFVRIKVTGKENIPKGNCVIAPNQLSHIDGAIIKNVINKNFFALTEPFQKFNLFFVLWMKKLSYVDVRRTPKEGRKYKKSHTKKQAVKLCVQQLKQGLSVLIFPEGHFERKKKLMKFYRGAAMFSLKAGVPMWPISIVGSEKFWPPDKLLRGPATIQVKIGKPIYLKKIAKPSDKLIKSKTILLKKEIAKLLPKSFLEKRWEKNE